MGVKRCPFCLYIIYVQAKTKVYTIGNGFLNIVVLPFVINICIFIKIYIILNSQFFVIGEVRTENRVVKRLKSQNAWHHRDTSSYNIIF